MSTTRIQYYIKAPPANVYRALLDANSIARWKVPDGMSSHVHVFEPREGGQFRVSLTYEDSAYSGKTTTHTDTYHGHFVKLVPNEQVVEMTEFETEDPLLQGKMMITTTLKEADGGTEVFAEHDGLPAGVKPEDNEAGWRMSLEKLAKLVESELL